MLGPSRALGVYNGAGTHIMQVSLMMYFFTCSCLVLFCDSTFFFKQHSTATSPTGFPDKSDICSCSILLFVPFHPLCGCYLNWHLCCLLFALSKLLVCETIQPVWWFSQVACSQQECLVNDLFVPLQPVILL